LELPFFRPHSGQLKVNAVVNWINGQEPPRDEPGSGPSDLRRELPGRQRRPEAGAALLVPESQRNKYKERNIPMETSSPNPIANLT
jgi:hypothetical protein